MTRAEHLREDLRASGCYFGSFDRGRRVEPLAGLMAIANLRVRLLLVLAGRS